MKRSMPGYGALLGLIVPCLLLSSCGSSGARDERRVFVAASANLSDALEQISAEFQREYGITVVTTLGSTVQLAQQVEAGAPFDVFAASDTAHVDRLVEQGKIVRESRLVYARGSLALWVPNAAKGVHELQDLTKPEIRSIAIAQPELAPYGQAAVDALRAASLWDSVQPKIVYTNNTTIARQHAEIGNADSAITAYSLLLQHRGTVLKIDERLHQPLDQAAGIVTGTKRPELARQFLAFLREKQGRAILAQNGYTLPAYELVE